jgi:hypothetical protein
MRKLAEPRRGLRHVARGVSLGYQVPQFPAGRGQPRDPERGAPRNAAEGGGGDHPGSQAAAAESLSGFDPLPRDGIELTPFSPELAAQMETAERVMREDRDVLRKLAE